MGDDVAGALVFALAHGIGDGFRAMADICRTAQTSFCDACEISFVAQTAAVAVCGFSFKRAYKPRT